MRSQNVHFYKEIACFVKLDMLKKMKKICEET